MKRAGAPHEIGHVLLGADRRESARNPHEQSAATEDQVFKRNPLDALGPYPRQTDARNPLTYPDTHQTPRSAAEQGVILAQPT